MPRLLGGIALGLLALLALWLTRPAPDSEAPPTLADSAAEPIGLQELDGPPKSATTRAATEEPPPIANGAAPQDHAAFAPVPLRSEDPPAGTSDELLVEVIDPDGRQIVDYGVRLGTRIIGAASGNGSMRYFPPLSGPKRVAISIGDVRAFFTDARRYARERPFEIALTLNAPVGCSEYVFRDLAIPTETIRLQIAAGGRVRVNAVDGAGALIARRLSFQLRAVPVTTPLDDDEYFRRLPMDAAEVASGTHLFTRVLTSSIVDVRVIDRSGAVNDRTLRVPGPAKPGEEIALTIRLDAAPRVCGRMLDEKGEPLRDLPFVCTLRTRNSQRGASPTTDDEGRFSFPWPESAREMMKPESIEFHAERSTPKRSLSMLAPEMPEVGTLDLGDLVLASTPPEALLAAGRVVDRSGRPLRRVHITFSDGGSAAPAEPGSTGFRIRLAAVTSDRQGRFELRSAEPIRSVRLRPSVNGYALANSPVFDAGRTDIELVMHEVVSLRGTVLLDDAQLTRRLRLTAEVDGEVHARGRVEENGSFVLANLGPGSYRVCARLHELMLTTIHVELTSQAEQRDPRLDPLDLRSVLRPWRTRLVGPGGESLSSLLLVLSPCGEHEGFVKAGTDKEGRSTFSLPNGVETLRLFAGGRLSTEIAWSAEEQAVALGEAPKLRFRAISPFPLPPEFEVSVTLGMNRGDAPDPLRIAAVALRPQFARAVVGQELVHDAVWPGRYAFRWQMRSKLLGDIIEIALVPIDIGSEAPADPIEIAPPAADLAKAIAEMRRREGR